MGINFFSDQKDAEEPEEQIPTREIDYDTGVQDMGFRVEFSIGDNDKCLSNCGNILNIN